METESFPELSEAIFLVACIVTAIYMHYEALEFSPEAAILPRLASIIIIAGAVMLLVRGFLPESIRELIESGDVLDDELREEFVEEDVEPNDRYMAYVAATTVGYVVIGYLIGLLWATPLMLVAYCELFDVDRKVTGVLVAIGFAITYAFVTVLNLSIETGVLTEGLL